MAELYTMLDPPETVSWCPASSQEKTSWTDVSWVEEATKRGQWFCWCHVFREVIPGLRAGDRKSWLPTVDSLLVGTTRRLVPTECSDRRLGKSATRVKGPWYPDELLYQNSKISLIIADIELALGSYSLFLDFIVHPQMTEPIPDSSPFCCHLNSNLNFHDLLTIHEPSCNTNNNYYNTHHL